MAELKTRKTTQSVKSFLETITDPKKQRDCKTIARLMEKATGAKPKMWGASIVGFGDYHYVYESGRENDWFIMGFSPRKNALTLYVMGATQSDLLKQLGKHKTGNSCLYVKDLADIDMAVLDKIIKAGANTNLKLRE